MNSFDLKVESPVLLTVPVLIYAIFAREPYGSYPLSPECNILVDGCRSRRFRGVITTNTISRCWTVVQKLSQRVEELESDLDETTGHLGRIERHGFKPKIPKRISALLSGDLRIITVEPRDFEAAATLTKDFNLPASIALDVAAVVRECRFNPLSVALSGKPAWKPNDNLRPCWCSDLPWQTQQKSLSQLRPNQKQGRLGI